VTKGCEISNTEGLPTCPARALAKEGGIMKIWLLAIGYWLFAIRVALAIGYQF
jgi:hypothetical protein